ncbi:hypothetical protein HB761_24305 [Vibrio campbellii]|uniref:Uncharacterized protein n=1 Tax=Vibrio campbellii TaxID=680 RepID=A0AAE9SRU9_9VIBR|nr:hypothetical protein [Vibrio campbellii]UTZ29695.1 hypothetical protein HB761_24305 [Vibrio campbellii]
MEKLAIFLTSMFASSVFAGSYQYGTVSEYVVETNRVTFQLNTSYGEDIRAEGCDGEPLNFSIDLNEAAAPYMVSIIEKAALDNYKQIGVNGDGHCWGNGEFEKVESIAPVTNSDL